MFHVPNVIACEEDIRYKRSLDVVYLSDLVHILQCHSKQAISINKSSQGIMMNCVQILHMLLIRNIYLMNHAYF